MASITTRAGKGSPLTNAELDANFTNINTELGQKLTANQNITVSGDASGSGTTAISLTLANSGVTAGTYGNATNIPQFAVDAKGRITSVSNVAVSIPSGSLTFTGDVTGTGSTGSSTALTLANSGVTAGTYRSVTVDAKGRVTGGTNPTTLSGYGITDAQPLDSDLTAIAALTPTLDNFIVGNGTSWILETPAQARASLGGTTVGQNIFTLTNPSAISFLRLNADNTVSALDAATFRTAIGAGTSSTTGTVTSVSGTGTVSGLTLSGTVTSSGSLTLGGTLTLTSGQVTTALGYTPPQPTGTGASGTWGINITGSAGVSSTVASQDIRTLSPSSLSTAGRLMFGFTSWANNNTSDWADYLLLRSYTDATGGADNLVTFKKSGIGMRIWQQTYGSATAFSSYVDVLTSGNYTSYSPSLTGSGASGTWGINVTGNAATATRVTGGNLTPFGTGFNNALASASGSNRVIAFDGNGTLPSVWWTNGATAIGAIDGNSGGGLQLWANNGSAWQQQATVGYGAFNVLTTLQQGGNQVLHAGNYTSYSPSLTGSGASGTWGINVTGNAGTATTLQTARTINGTSFNGSASIDTTEWYHSDRDFPNGTLITTNINYAVWGGDAWVLEIRGNSYGNIVPLDLLYQGYIYSDTIINHGGVSNGLTITGMVALNVGGNLCFWFPSQGYWNGYNVKVYAAFATRPTNRVTSITGTAKPSGTKEVALSANIRQSLHSGNYTSYAPSLTGSGASGTWGISITGNAATATTASNSSAFSGLSISQLFNNMGNSHTTYGDANSIPNFGFYYLQGTANGPGNGNSQWYGMQLGLGNDYAYSSYAMQFAIPRTPVGGNPYPAVRFRENGSWGSWSKIWAGYADSAGTATSATSATSATTASSVSGLTLTSSANGINPDSVTQNQIGYNTSVSLFGQTDGGLYSSAHSSSWIHQIYGDFRTGQIATRGKNSGTWQSWRVQLDSGNFSSYALPLSGGTVTGELLIQTGNSSSQQRWKKTSQSSYSHLAWDGAIYHGYQIYYSGGGWVHDAPSGNPHNALLAVVPGTGVSWYASSNSSGSWNVASNVALWNNSGTWTGGLNAASGAQVAGNTIVHAGNVASYVSAGGGPAFDAF